MPNDSDSKNPDLNDERYTSDNKPYTATFDVSKLTRCPHHFFRRSYTMIECDICHTGLLDPTHKIEIKDGQLAVSDRP